MAPIRGAGLPALGSWLLQNIVIPFVYLKAEFRQKTGSFKIRGAYYKIQSLSDEEKKYGVVAASASELSSGS